MLNYVYIDCLNKNLLQNSLFLSNPGYNDTEVFHDREYNYHGYYT